MDLQVNTEHFDEFNIVEVCHANLPCCPLLTSGGPAVQDPLAPPYV